MPDRKAKHRGKRIELNPLNLGCLSMSLLIGILVGLGGTHGVLPGWLNWLIGGLFVIFFGLLSFIMTSIATRREETDRQNDRLDSGNLLQKLKTFIMSNNQSAKLDITKLSALDQDMATLDELTTSFKDYQGLNEHETQTLNAIIKRWLTPDQLDLWYRYSRPTRSNN